MNTNPGARRLLLLITKTNFGGAQRYVYDLAVALRDHGYVVAVAGGGTGDLTQKLARENIATYEIAGAQRDFSITKEIVAMRSLTKIIREFKPDVIHANSSKLGGIGSLIGRLLGVPRIVFTAHGWPFLEPRSTVWRTFAWLGSYATGLLAHQVILVSEHDLRHTTMPGVRRKCTVIHTAVSDFPLRPRDEARRALVGDTITDTHAHNVWVGTIGELHHNKNHELAIDAIANFNQNQQTKVLFIVISDGELRQKLEEQVSLRGLTDYVYFVGHHTDARQYLNAFDIFLFPSRKEGLPFALLEAGKAGLPCVASFVGGIPEVIENLKTGLLIDPYRPDSIETALLHLINEPDARIHYGDNLRAHIEHSFNLETMIKKTMQLYEG